MSGGVYKACFIFSFLFDSSPSVLKHWNEKVTNERVRDGAWAVTDFSLQRGVYPSISSLLNNAEKFGDFCRCLQKKDGYQSPHLGRGRRVGVKLCSTTTCGAQTSLHLWCLWRMTFIVCLLGCILCFTINAFGQGHTHAHSCGNEYRWIPVRKCARAYCSALHDRRLPSPQPYKACLSPWVLSVHRHAPQRSLWRHNRWHMALKILLYYQQ